MSASQTASVAASATELELVRVIDAPRRLVYAAWTDPEHVAKWFVLDGMSTQHVAIDVRPGGAWLIHLRMPDGTPVVVSRIFHEIVPLTRIVFYEKCMAGDRVALDGVHTVSFEELGGKTKLTVRCELATPFDRDNQMGWSGGWNQIFDHLDVHVAPIHAELSQREIATTRLLPAPRERVFAVWTDPAHMAQWWGPDGFSVTTTKMEVRTGGEWIYTMHGPDGTDYPNRIAYELVVPPERLEYTLRGGKAGDEPSQHRTTVIFTEENGQTRLDMQMLFASPAARDAVAKKYGAVQGLQQTLGRLDTYLAAR